MAGHGDLEPQRRCEPCAEPSGSTLTLPCSWDHGSEQPPVSQKCAYVVVTCKGNGRKKVQQDSFAPEAGSWGSSLNVASVCLVLTPASTDKDPAPNSFSGFSVPGAVFRDVAKACVLK